ncbi:MAG: 50S ribosomal protein L11 methyltransferase [Bacteroidales bacterium]|nr:50S ribosomal protein L11 methyltransferase [Bacteroidales bacterium]
MKKFYEVSIPLSGEVAEFILARLSGLGFLGFIEEDERVVAYLEKDRLDAGSLHVLLSENNISGAKISEIEDRNWNAEWESDYEPVIIDGKIMVRAPFHDPVPDIEWDIIIEPKMSFGTAHHETTSQMLSLIARMDLAGKSVLDMGCGTAVLAILASKMGATHIFAVDNDEWAYRNALENTILNNTEDIEVFLGDRGSLENRHFDIIIANINRNILLQDIPYYAAALKPGGTLMMSGFYLDDLEQINNKGVSCRLRLADSRSKNKWTAAVFIKDQAND